jgi:hypothetical protein
MISKNGAGLVVLILSLLGVQVAESQIVELITSVGTVASIILMIWNQLGRSDVTGFLFKKW